MADDEPIDELEDDTARPVEVDEVLPSSEIAESSFVAEDTDIIEVDRPDVPAATTKDVVRYDPLESYLSEIKHIPALSREDEHDLAVRYFETKDSKAAYKIVVSNLRLVVLIARDYQRNFQNILDLVQEGNIGLLEAVKQFDPFRGIRFPTYATYWIRAYILRYLINNVRLVKVGTTQAQRKLFFNLQKEKDKLEAEGFAPEARLLADRLNVKESEVIEMQQRLALPDLSVDAPTRVSSEDAGDLHNFLPNSDASPEERVASEQFSEAFRDAVAEFRTTLDAKEQEILDARLITEDPVTLQVIADKYSLSRERIRQIEARLKTRLKEFLQDKLDLDQSGAVSVGEDGRVSLRMIFWIVVLSILLAAAFYLKRLSEDDRYALYFHFFESVGPEITFIDPPPGLGAGSNRVQISLRDPGAGLDEVVVRLEQGGDVRELVRKRYHEDVRQEIIELTIEPKKLKLTEGNVRFYVKAFDRAFWSNGNALEQDLPVDYRKPRIEVLSAQHNATVGGTELAFYRANDSDLKESGVLAGSELFLGQPAKLLNTAFSVAPDVFFSLFSIPLGFNEATDPVHVVASDTGGNVSTSGFYYRAALTRRPVRDVEAVELMDPLRLDEMYQSLRAVDPSIPETEDVTQQFVAVNGKLRDWTERRVREIARSAADTPARWVAPASEGIVFLRPSAAESASFGEKRRYLLSGSEIGNSESFGVDLAMSPGAAVSAAAAGTTLFVGSLGIYGNCVIIDHGAGVTSLYAHLSNATVSVGQTLERGDVIGNVGWTGLVRRELLHFQIRLQGVAVRPIEWWDKRWVHDHLVQKIEEGLRASGAQVSDVSSEAEG